MNQFYKRFVWLGILLALVLAPNQVRAQDVSYSLAPSYEELRWDDAFGLEDSRLYGARATLDFGPFFSLQPFYEWDDDVRIRSDITLSPDAEVADTYDVKAFGAEFQVNFGSGSLIPFAKAGGGVLRTEDAIAGRRDRVMLRYGGGLGFGLGDRARAEIFGERVAIRLDSPFIPGAADVDDLPEDGIVNSVLVGAGFRLPLGGRSQGADQGFGILPGIFLEPWVSRIDFDGKLRLDRQYTAGGRVGLDLNQNVGFRAFYWRGVTDDFDETADLEGYGAEAQFALNSGPGVSPFLILGAGRIDFEDEFSDLDGAARDSQDHFTLGGGFSVGLGERTSIDLAVRDLLMTVGEDLEDVSDPNDLVSNWQYSVGLSVALGATPRSERADAAESDRERRDREMAVLIEENRALRAGEDVRIVDGAVVPADTIEAPRTITIPVPEIGEIILRYGAEYAGSGDGPVVITDSTGVDQAALTEAVRQAVRDEIERLDLVPAGQPAPAVQPSAVEAPSRSFMEGRDFNALLPYVGLQASSPEQFLIGLRADMGVISDAVPIDVIPDVVFGVFGGSPTLMVGINGRFGWELGFERYFFPYVEAGVALASRKFLTVNLGYGMEFDIGDAPSARRLFVEHRGVGAFDEHQFIAGVRLPR